MDPATGSPRARRRARWAALCGLVAGLVLAVPVAWASHQFTDVPNANPFHTEIGAISDAGITGGKTCVPPGTPPTYCPDEPVTRQAMAAFMHRGYGRVGSQTPFLSTTLTTTEADLAVVTIQVGGVPGKTQFVQLHGAATAFIGDATGCPCTSAFRMVHDGDDFTVGAAMYNTNEELGSGDSNFQSTGLSGAMAVPSGTTQTFRLKGVRIFNTGGTVQAFGTLTAVVVPFGSTGGSTLGTTTTLPAKGTPANPIP